MTMTMRMLHFYARPHPARRREKQAGLVAMAMAVVLVVFCAVLLGGGMAEYARSTGKTAGSQQDAARLAERAINAFAALHGRLPCPATQRRGAENCAGFAKGWLPVETLETTDSALVSSLGQLADIRYVVYRGYGAVPRDPDLSEPELSTPGSSGAAPSDGYSPVLLDGLPVEDYPVVSSSLDLCGRLRLLLPNPDPSKRWETGDPLAAGPGRVDRAHVPLAPPSPGTGSAGGGAAGVMNVAYALAVLAPGKGRPVPDVNDGTSSPAMESPRRPAGPDYADVVRAVDPRGLYQALACGAAVASLDNLAVAQAWTADAAAMKTGNVNGGKDIQKMGVPVAVGDGAGVASEAINVANGVYNEWNLAAKKAEAVMTPPLFLIYLAGDVKAILGLLLSAIDMGRASANLAVDSLFVVKYTDVADKASKLPVWTGGAAILQQADENGLVNARAK